MGQTVNNAKGQRDARQLTLLVLLISARYKASEEMDHACGFLAHRPNPFGRERETVLRIADMSVLLPGKAERRIPCQCRVDVRNKRT